MRFLRFYGFHAVRFSQFHDPLFQNHLLMRLNLGEYNSHSRSVPRMGHFAHSWKVRSAMLNPNPDSRSGWQRILRGHAASEQVYVAGLLDKLRF
jgi:hypothetical protein